MANIIEMPKLSDTMTTGTVVKWLKREGDTVKNGDMIAEVETDKATMELEAFFDGTLLKIFVPAGSQAPLGAALCAIGKPGEGFGFATDGEDRFRFGIVDDRSDEPVVDRDREGDVSIGVMVDAGILPRAIDRGDPTQRLGAGLEDEVVDGEIHAVRFHGRVQLRPQGQERPDVDVDFEIDMGRLGLRLHGAPGDDRPHVGERDDLVLLDRARLLGHPAGHGGDRMVEAGALGGEDIRADDPAARAGAGGARGVDAFFVGQLLGEGRNPEAAPRLSCRIDG